LSSTDAPQGCAPEAPRDGLSDRAKWAILSAFALVLVATLVAGAEWAIRARQVRSYGTAATVEQSYVVDPRIDLRVPIANLKSGRIETNSLGFRGPEIPAQKRQGTLRMAFLGASTTWCAEVSGNDKVWPHIVTEDLKRSFPEKSLDYVNGSVPGYTVKSSLKNLRYRVSPLRPDVIVIYHATNDMSAELRQLAAAKGVAREALVEKPSWLAEHSLLWNLAEKNWRIWIAKRKAAANIGRLEFEPAILGEGFRRDLTELISEAKQHAKVVAVATFSSQLRPDQDAEQQLRASESALYYMPFMTPSSLVAAYARYNQVIREVVAATGAVLVAGEDDIPGDPQHFADSVHFTDNGSERMAMRVASALKPHVASLPR